MVCSVKVSSEIMSFRLAYNLAYRTGILATILPRSHFSAVYLHLAPSDFIGLSNQLSSFLTNMVAALAPQGILNISYPPNDYLPTLSAEISAVGLNVQSSGSSSLIAQKPTSPAAPGASVSLRTRRAPLTTEQKAAKKAAIWAVSPASSSTIDSESLLTPEDRVRPTPTCAPADASGAIRRKRACKGCTCGLAEFEAEEAARTPVVVLDTSVDNDGGAVRTMSKEDREKLRQAALNAGKATSSCGSCYLGDAFRCAGCPYLGEYHTIDLYDLINPSLRSQVYPRFSLVKRLRLVQEWMIFEI